MARFGHFLDPLVARYTSISDKTAVNFFRLEVKNTLAYLKNNIERLGVDTDWTVSEIGGTHLPLCQSSPFLCLFSIFKNKKYILLTSTFLLKISSL